MSENPASGGPSLPAAPDETSGSLPALLKLLDLETIEVDVFRGISPKDRWQRVFGGQVLGQALVAAQRTVEDRLCHSLHGYFLRAGDPRTPILYQVDRSRDGGSFSARRVVAVQHGEAIFTLSASFQAEAEGYEHQIPMPDVPPPESLRSESEWRAEALADVPDPIRAWFARPRPLEFRPVEPLNRFAKGPKPPRQTLWFRASGQLPDAPSLHQCIAAYASDMTLLDTSLLPHGLTLFSGEVQLASLDHAMWFHRGFRADEWLLYVQDSPVAAAARSFNRGMIFTREGVLVASVAQEGLTRPRKPAGKSTS